MEPFHSTIKILTRSKWRLSELFARLIELVNKKEFNKNSIELLSKKKLKAKLQMLAQITFTKNELLIKA